MQVQKHIKPDVSGSTIIALTFNLLFIYTMRFPPKIEKKGFI